MQDRFGPARFCRLAQPASEARKPRLATAAVALCPYLPRRPPRWGRDGSLEVGVDGVTSPNRSYSSHSLGASAPGFGSLRARGHGRGGRLRALGAALRRLRPSGLSALGSARAASGASHGGQPLTAVRLAGAVAGAGAASGSAVGAASRGRRATRAAIGSGRSRWCPPGPAPGPGRAAPAARPWWRPRSTDLC